MTKRAVRLGALIFFCLGALMVLPGTAEAQNGCEMTPAYEGTANVGTSVTTVDAGGTIVLEGTGWPPDSTLDISVNGEPVGTATTDAAGAFSFAYTVPANASGTQTFGVGCGAFVLSTQFSVTAPTTPAQPLTPAPAPAPAPAAPAATALPVTGSDNLSWVQIGLALVALGAVLLVLTRRQTRAAQPAER